MDPNPGLTSYRLPEEEGPFGPLPGYLDTAERWRARTRLVRPGAEPVGRVAIGGEWVPVYPVPGTVPIETDADPDATSAAPRSSRIPGVYDYARDEDPPDDDPA